MQLQVEPSNVCNAACVFCPYPQMKRPKGLMSMALFKKIVDEAATIPLITHLTLTGLGEPMLDPHLKERIQYARSHLFPGIVIDLFTNGSYLTAEKGAMLFESGLNVIYVSLNGATADKRRQIMKVDDYDKVVEECDRLIAWTKERKRGTVVVKTIVSKDLMEVGESEEFQARWGGPQEKGGNAFLHLEGNWAGTMYPLRVRPTLSCARALDEIMVLWDGRVSLCCFDGEGEVIYGDLNNQSIREVFASEKAVGYRKAHVEGRRGDLFLCKTCTAI